MQHYNALTKNILQNRLLSQIQDILVLTDPVEYAGVDQVFPMYPEQPYFLDELVKPDIQGAQVLEIGLGSGVLSIGALKAGAAQVTALEINPRAKLFAGFNAILNGINAGLCILDGNTQDIWQPVNGRQFDYVISNPPFMPTPPDAEHYFHSGGGGILGMDFMDKILQQLDQHLIPGGRAQIVTAAPGDDQLPTALTERIATHLSGSAELVIDPLRLSFDVLQHHLPENITDTAMKKTSRMLEDQGITHQYLCVIHYLNNKNKAMTTRFCAPHANWDQPLTHL